MDLLDEYGIDYEVIPGVSSFWLRRQRSKRIYFTQYFTNCYLYQIEGRTPVPERESLESLASHRASMAIFLSVHMIGEVVKRLETSYPKETPIAVVQRATWEDQKIVMGTLENIEVKVREAKLKTAQILVEILGNEYENQSCMINILLMNIERESSKNIVL